MGVRRRVIGLPVSVVATLISVIATGGLGNVAGASTSTASLATAQVVAAGRLTGLRYHLVAKGESLAAIAKRYRVDAAQIRRANGITKDGLYAGERLLLDEPNPPDASPGWGAMSPSSATGSAGSPTTYRVVAGDTLARIARTTSTTVPALLAANQLKITATLQIGQVLSLTGAPGLAAPVAGPHAVRCPLPSAMFNFDWGFPREGGRFHEGTDMFAPTGTPILAPVGGAVSVGTSAISGLSVTLRGADGWQYFGAHLSKVGTKKTRVKAGDVIGYVGTSGDAAGGPPHLHIEMRPLDGRPTNPFPFLTTLCHH